MSVNGFGGVLKPKPMFFQKRFPPLPGLFPFPDFFELRKTFGCFKNAFSVCSAMATGCSCSPLMDWGKMRCSLLKQNQLLSGCSLPLTPSFSAALHLALVTCHTHTQLNLELPKDLTLTTIIQCLFYIRSSKENRPMVRKISMKEQLQNLKNGLLRFFFTNDLISLDIPGLSLTSAVEKHLQDIKSERRTFELAISQKISLLCWFNRSKRCFWEEESLPFYTRRSPPRRI